MSRTAARLGDRLRTSKRTAAMDLQLEGKRALVTGGSRGIGREIARHLASEGARVAITARGREALDAAVADIRASTGGEAVAVVADMSDDSSVERMVDETVSALGSVDILVNNAATPGGGKAALVEQVVVSSLLDDIDVKVGGYLRAARCVAPLMVAAGWGRIINIGGLAARKSGNYNAAIRNGSISAITKNLADELGPRGVNVVAVHPGAMRLPGMDAEAEARASAQTSNGALFEISAIAWLVTMLASPGSVALNGETLQAGGGIRGRIDY